MPAKGEEAAVAHSDVLVVGRGIIGLGVAWRTAQRGLTVAGVDPRPGGGAAPGAAGLPAAGTELTVEGRPVGTLGSNAGTIGLAIARIDRVKAALDAGQPIMAGDVPVAVTIPAWAKFSFPQEAVSAEEA